MRNTRHIHWVQVSVAETARKIRFVKAGGNPEKHPREGCDPAWHIFMLFIAIGKILKEKIIKLLRKNKPDSQRLNLIIRAADWVREKGQVRPISEDPVLEESIGILFNIIRRRNKVALEKLAKASGYRIEELIAFEAGLLPRLRVCEMLPVLARSVGVTDEELLQEVTNIFFDI